jgi:hypothetical protein
MTTDVTITIKNIPTDGLNLVWKDLIDFGKNVFKDHIEPTNNFIFYCDSMVSDSFERIIGSAISEYCASINAERLK